MASDAARKDARERSLGGAALRLLALLALAAVVIRTRVVLAAARVGDAVEVAWRGKFRLESLEIYRGTAWWVAIVVDKVQLDGAGDRAPRRHRLRV